MNPALLNYYQQAQGGGEQQAPAEYNPFDIGISRAIESARESLGMTQKQQDKALRSSLLAFGQNLGQQPRQTGFLNNLLGVGQALGPAVSQYDQEEDTALKENNNLANQILGYQNQRLNRDTTAEDKDWQRNMAERQFAESQNQNNLLNAFRQDSLASKELLASAKGHGKETAATLLPLLDSAEKLIIQSGNNAQRGLIANFANNRVPGAAPYNEDQANINALGEILQGKLFNYLGYTSTAEFEHIPTITANNSPEVNLAIIRQIKNSLGGGGQAPVLGNTQNILQEPQAESPAPNAQDIVNISQEGAQIEPTTRFMTPEGVIYNVPEKDIKEAESLGLVRVGN